MDHHPKAMPGVSFESKVYSLLCSCCDGDELCTVAEESCFADFFLKNGCNKIGVPKETEVIVLDDLLFDTAERIKRYSKSSLSTHPILIIHKEKNTNVKLRDIIQIRAEDKVFLKSYQELVLGANPLPEKSDCSEAIIQLAKSAYQKGPVTLFLGAGVSADAHLPDWDGLQRALLKQKGVDIELRKVKKTCHDSDLTLTANFPHFCNPL